MEPTTVEEKRAQAAQLIKDGYFADAFAVLEGLARNRSPRAGEHARWAREQIPKVKAALSKARAECEDAYRLAEQLYDDGNYAEAVEILERFKRGSRSAAAEDLLREAQRDLKKVTRLNEAIDRALYRKETDTDEFYDTLVDLLELTPKDRRARQLLKKLDEQRRRESYFGWRFGVAVLGVLCLGAVAWICKLVFWPGGEGTITIILQEPGFAVYIDGELLPASDYERPLRRYKAGEHSLELRRGLDVVSKQMFTVEANLDKILRVPEEQVDFVSNDAGSDPLPMVDVPTEPLDSQEITELDPEPMDEPEEQVQAVPIQAAPPEPPTVNGFPIAKQTGYLHLTGPSVTPQHAVFSRDAAYVAAERLSSEADDPQKTYDVYVWDTATGKPVQIFSVLSGEFQGMAFSPDGKLIATAHADLPDATSGTLQIWNVESGALEQTILLSVPAGQDKVEVRGVAFSEDAEFVGIINQNAAYVWTVSEGESKFKRSMAPATLTAIDFAPIGEILILGATGNPDGIMSWNLQTNVRLGYFDAGRTQDTAHPTFAISPDRSVMTILNENSVRRYASTTGRPLSFASLPRFTGETQVMTRVDYAPSGQYVMASALGRRPLIWQDADFNRIAILGESSSVGAYAAAFSPDSQFVLQLDRPDASDLEASAAVIRTWQIKDSGDTDQGIIDNSDSDADDDFAPASVE